MSKDGPKIKHDEQNCTRLISHGERLQTKTRWKSYLKNDFISRSEIIKDKADSHVLRLKKTNKNNAPTHSSFKTWNSNEFTVDRRKIICLLKRQNTSLSSGSEQVRIQAFYDQCAFEICSQSGDKKRLRAGTPGPRARGKTHFLPNKRAQCARKIIKKSLESRREQSRG